MRNLIISLVAGSLILGANAAYAEDLASTKSNLNDNTSFMDNVRFNVAGGGGYFYVKSGADTHTLGAKGFQASSTYNLANSFYITATGSATFLSDAPTEMSFLNDATKYDLSLTIGKTFNPVGYVYVSPYVGVGYSDFYGKSAAIDSYANNNKMVGVIITGNAMEGGATPQDAQAQAGAILQNPSDTTNAAYIAGAKDAAKGIAAKELDSSVYALLGTSVVFPLSETFYLTGDINYDFNNLTTNGVTHYSGVKLGATYKFSDNVVDYVSLAFQIQQDKSKNKGYGLALNITV